MTFSRSEKPLLGPEIICLIFLVLYMLTTAPSLGWRDAPEFTVTTHTLGIAHPAGFPTYSLLSKLLTFIPLGSIPFRINLFSALFAALTLYTLYLLVKRLAGDENKALDEFPAALAAACSVLVLGLSATLWENATTTEVYSLNLFFLAVMFYAAIRWSSGQGDAWLYAGSFLYGLAAGNHAAVALYLPAFLLFFFLRGRENTFQRFFPVVFFFLIGFSVYLYLPLRSLADPTIDRGNPETLANFLSHITDRKDAGTHFQTVRGGVSFFEPARVFLIRTVPWFFWPFGLPLVLVGLTQMLRSNRVLAAALVYITLANIFFFIDWTNATAFLPAWFCLALLWGIGMAWILSRMSLPDKRSGRMVLTGLFILLLSGGIALQLPHQNRSHAFLAMEIFRADYENMAPDAISLTSIQWFHQRAFQDVYRQREDITVIGLSDFISPDYFHYVTAGRFPKAAVPPGSYSRESGVEFLQKFIAANLDNRREIYWEPTDMTEIFFKNLAPELEILFKFTRRPVERLEQAVVQAAFDRLRLKLEQEIDREGLLADKRVDAYYIRFLIRFADYLRLHRRGVDAIATINLVEGLFGADGKDSLDFRTLNNLDNLKGAIFLNLGRVEEAEDRFKHMAERDDLSYDAWANLGLIYLKTGRPGLALEALNKAVSVNPLFPEAYFSLARYFRQKGDLEKAGEYYLKSKALNPKPGLASEIRKDLETLAKGGDSP
ncbi:MAG: DUF2723 domain-containing protein [Deltaproteobacteria bacterium]|nr:DUF2723 domain-containing protein [Deltaproteobacteria bacterium]